MDGAKILGKDTKKEKNKNHWYYQVQNLGFKYNMNDLIASIAISQLRKLKILIESESRYLKGIFFN